jgi:hypothetical protein
VAAKSIAVILFFLFFGFRASGFLFLRLAGYKWLYIYKIFIGSQKREIEN